jgi:hypothetical protein
MEYGCGVLHVLVRWVRLTASLIAPITFFIRREEFHDDGNIPSIIFLATVNVFIVQVLVIELWLSATYLHKSPVKYIEMSSRLQSTV